MKYSYRWLVIFFTINAMTAAGEETRTPGAQIRPGNYVDDYEYRNAIPQGQSLEDDAHDAANENRGHSPEITPNGWLDDYNYMTDLDSYLNEKYQSALNSAKNTYVYLYADWYEACREFRKTVKHKDYVELFSANEMVMVDYNFFRKRFDFQAQRLPMIVKVNDSGILGPEHIYPVANANDHPRKIYYKLKKFFSGNEAINKKDKMASNKYGR